MQLKTYCPYNVGDYYITANAGNPTGLWPNTSWEQIQDVFLLASGTRTAGDTGGAEDVTLTTDQIPSHSHSVGAHAHGLNSHTHSVGAHKHTVPEHGHTYTRPTVSSSGYVANGVPSNGAHTHDVYADGTNRAQTKDGVLQTNLTPNWSRGIGCWSSGGSNISMSSAGAHTHNLPNHTHTLTGGSVANKAAFDTNNSAAFNSGTPSTANTANSAAFDSGAAGGGSAHSNMPPYLTVNVWKRVA